MTVAKLQAESKPTTPANGIFHPLTISAVLLLLINDHWLKEIYPGWLSGKLSDVAGMIFFPLFLQGLWELFQYWRHRFKGPSARVLLVGCLSTALIFSLIQFWPPAINAYRYGLGTLQWPFLALVTVLDGSSITGIRPVSLTPDLTDLVAVPFAAIPLIITRIGGERR